MCWMKSPGWQFKTVQILSITEHWTWDTYDISFAFGKPQNNLSDQLQLMLRKIQEASNKTNSTDSVRWYTIPTDTAMPKADVTYNTIGFVGTVGTGATFTLYLDNEKTGAKTYHVYFKQLGGTGKLTLTTGKAGATNLTLNAGTYVAIIYVDENGNVTTQGTTVVNSVTVDNMQSVTSNAVAQAIANQNNVVVKIKANQYQYSDGKYGIDMQNSDIINFNALWANDYADNTDEGINFLRSNNNYDGIKALDGKLYFEKNINKTTKTSDGRQEVPTLVKTDASVTNIIKKYYTLGDLKIVLMQATVTYQTNQPSGAIYYALCSSIPFPITFTNKPTISMFTEYNGGNAWCWGATAVTTTETGAYYIARGNDRIVGVVVHIIAIGE